MKCLLLVGLLIAFSSVHADSQKRVPILKEADLTEWVSFNSKGLTLYDRVMDLEQGVVLRAESHNSASGYRYGETIDLTGTPELQWQWTVESFPHYKKVGEDGLEKPVTEFNEAHTSGDDFAVRLTVGQTKLFGENKALHYVWSSQSQAGGNWSLDAHNHVFAVNGRETSTLRWQTVKRHIANDWQKAFGETIKQVDYVAIMTDSENINGQAAGYYGDIVLVSPSR